MTALEQPISSVRDLVLFVLCEENISHGYQYLRGLSCFLDGSAPTQMQVALASYLVRFDDEVYGLFVQVAEKSQSQPITIIETVITILSKFYWSQSEDSRHG